jgi:hypothetical protein
MAESGQRLMVDGGPGGAPVVGAASVDAEEVRPAGRSADIDVEHVWPAGRSANIDPLWPYFLSQI